MSPRRGIALPMVLLVLAALGLLSALALLDAFRAWQVARLSNDEVQARAAAMQGIEALLEPDDVPWLCLQPPAAPRRVQRMLADGSKIDLQWWSLGSGMVRGQAMAVGPRGGRHRILVSLRADSLPEDSLGIGCPAATRLRSDGPGWMMAHPDG